MEGHPRASELADQNSPKISSDSRGKHKPGEARRWPIIQKNPIRKALIGLVLTGCVFGGMHELALRYEVSLVQLHAVLGIASFAFAVFLSLMAESVIEDGVKVMFIALLGYLFSDSHPLPWCLLPAAAGLVGSIINGTIQATLGRIC